MSKKFVLSLLAGALLCTAAGYQSAEALNPQPLPPMKRNPIVTTTVIHGNQTGPRRLNPQPLPPG
jgi:hypothetical protein